MRWRILICLLCIVMCLAMAPKQGLFNCIRTAPFHPAIHNLGNCGMMGAFHAKGATAVTKVIDIVAYNGRNMRGEVADGLASLHSPDTNVLEIGCGSGTMTRELLRHFWQVTAMDTSFEMLERARKEVPNALYIEGNGVDAHLVGSCDLAMVSMVCHELPPIAILDLLSAVNRVAREVWVVDVDPSYHPSMMMLSGEPYVLDYVKYIKKITEYVAERTKKKLSTFRIVDGHVRGFCFEGD